jgi:hypothetical protein
MALLPSPFSLFTQLGSGPQAGSASPAEGFIGALVQPDIKSRVKQCGKWYRFIRLLYLDLTLQGNSEEWLLNRQIEPAVFRFLPGLLLASVLLNPNSAHAELDLGNWDVLLGSAVNDGFVDYGQWANNPRFDELVEQIAQTDTDTMNTDQKLVFYINAYNILAARGILDGGSPESVLGRYFYFKRSKYRVAGREISLHQLEHEWIRPLKEPRIHFAIVCASQSCPILQSEAYRLETLDQQLESAAMDFINDSERNRFDTAEGLAELSSIFKWFSDDFVEVAGSLQAYLAPLVKDEDVTENLEKGAFEIEYLDYDWRLNGTR